MPNSGNHELDPQHRINMLQRDLADMARDSKRDLAEMARELRRELSEQARKAEDAMTDLGKLVTSQNLQLRAEVTEHSSEMKREILGAIQEREHVRVPSNGLTKKLREYREILQMAGWIILLATTAWTAFIHDQASARTAAAAQVSAVSADKVEKVGAVVRQLIESPELPPEKAK